MLVGPRLRRRRRRRKLRLWDYLIHQPTALYHKAYIAKVRSYNPIAYWPMGEASGGVATDFSGNGHDGAYTGVTLGQPGIGDGRTSPLFDGTNDYNDVHAAPLAAAFGVTAGTINIWSKVSAVGVWTDATTDQHFRFQKAGNIISAAKSANNQVEMFHIVGGVTNSVAIGGLTSTDFLVFGLTWDETADKMIAYLNGAQSGATQTGLGAWGAAGDITVAVIGAGSLAPDFPYNGYEAHCAVWDSAQPPAVMAELAAL